VAISSTLEFVGQERGWRAAAHLEDGRTITISEAQSIGAARRRLRRAVEAAGFDEPSFNEKLRIPAHLQSELTAYRLKETQRAALESEILEMRPRLAQKLLTELRLTEREVAAWLGLSHTHMSTLLLQHTADTVPTGEFRREAPVEPPATEDPASGRVTKR
jgi:hypothetical protein